MGAERGAGLRTRLAGRRDGEAGKWHQPRAEKQGRAALQGQPGAAAPVPAVWYLPGWSRAPR